jgi:Fe2+ or Zn2+ uptake regulation protein
VTTACKGCEELDCQDCCPHNEHECFICNDCGKELDVGEAIDRAMDLIDFREES